MRKLFVLTSFFLTSIFMTACTPTLSVTMVHTEGTAADVVDEAQTPSTTVTPTANVTVPASIVP